MAEFVDQPIWPSNCWDMFTHSLDDWQYTRLMQIHYLHSNFLDDSPDLQGEHGEHGERNCRFQGSAAPFGAEGVSQHDGNHWPGGRSTTLTSKRGRTSSDCRARVYDQPTLAPSADLVRNQFGTPHTKTYGVVGNRSLIYLCISIFI